MYRPQFGLFTCWCWDLQANLQGFQFSTLKEDELVKVNLIAKPKEKLNLITLLLFNGYILSLNKDFIALY